MLRKISKDELSRILSDYSDRLVKGEGPEFNLRWTDLRKVDLSRTILSNANLRGVYLCEANLYKSILEGADLRFANLSRTNEGGANLIGANLYSANLNCANLSFANMCGAVLYRADLSGANLSGANLSGADMRFSSLRGANLGNADLRGVNLYGADLRGSKNTDSVIFSNETAFFAMQCPEKGSYTAYKKAAHDLIVELQIPSDAIRFSATTRMCRASKAYVVSITDLDGKNPVSEAYSKFDPCFIYEVGKTVESLDFDMDRWNEYAPSIHHYITRSEAIANE